MATTFKSIWAIASDSPANVGDTIQVRLKSGETKPIVVGAVIRAEPGDYLFIPEDSKAQRSHPAPLHRAADIPA